MCCVCVADMWANVWLICHVWLMCKCDVPLMCLWLS